MYQYNLSSMLLENNGRFSSGNRTKHICVIYFLIKYRIEMGELRVEYFPTGKFWPITLPNHFKGLPSRNLELRFR